MRAGDTVARLGGSEFAVLIEDDSDPSAFVIAEGIETPGQLAAARAAGCDVMQGFLLGRPTVISQAATLDTTAA